MPKFTLTTYEAKPNGDGTFSMCLHIGGGHPLPRRVIEARTTGDALAALDAYLKEIEPLGKPLAVSLDLAKGERAPAGFRVLPQRSTLRAVNV
jgi:hypothetical protein